LPALGFKAQNFVRAITHDNALSVDEPDIAEREAVTCFLRTEGVPEGKFDVSIVQEMQLRIVELDHHLFTQKWAVAMEVHGGPVLVGYGRITVAGISYRTNFKFHWLQGSWRWYCTAHDCGYS